MKRPLINTNSSIVTPIVNTTGGKSRNFANGKCSDAQRTCDLVAKIDGLTAAYDFCGISFQKKA